jgi:hypothetical protein
VTGQEGSEHVLERIWSPACGWRLFIHRPGMGSTLNDMFPVSVIGGLREPDPLRLAKPAGLGARAMQGRWAEIGLVGRFQPFGLCQRVDSREDLTEESNRRSRVHFKVILYI